MPSSPPAPTLSLDQQIDQAFQSIADVADAVVMFEAPIFGVSVPLIVIWLIAGASFFTIFLGGINIRGFRHALRIVRGLEDDGDATRRRWRHDATTATTQCAYIYIYIYIYITNEHRKLTNCGYHVFE